MKIKALKLSIIIFTIILLAIPAGCSRHDHLSLPDDINKITIYKEGTANTTFSYTDAAKIETLIDYLNSMELTSTTVGPNNSETGYIGGWQLRAFSDDDLYGMTFVGDKFFQTPDGAWWEISPKQIAEFEELLKGQLPDELPSNKLFDEWK